MRKKPKVDPAHGIRGVHYSMTASKEFPWGAIELTNGVPVGKSRWFRARSEAVVCGRTNFKHYALARAWQIEDLDARTPGDAAPPVIMADPHVS